MGCEHCRKGDEHELELDYKGIGFEDNKITKYQNDSELQKYILENLKGIGKRITVSQFYKEIGDKYRYEYQNDPYTPDSKINKSELIEVDPIKFKNDSYYYGSWNKNGKFEGQGQFFARPKGKDVYVDGVFHDGKLEKGKIITEEGKYTGDIEENTFNGNGILEYSDGCVYDGEFRDGKKEGNGTLTFSDGSKFRGNFKDDDYGNYGAFTFSNPKGIKYEGELANGAFNGNGTLTIPQTMIYKGEFKNGLFHGKGKCIWIINHSKKINEVYEGDYFDGKKCGNGTYVFEDGSEIQGEFYEGELNGRCSLYKDGVKYIQDFANGEEIGEMEIENEGQKNNILKSFPNIIIKKEYFDLCSLPLINNEVIKNLYLQPEKGGILNPELDIYNYSLL